MITASENWIIPVLYLPCEARLVPRPIGVVVMSEEAEAYFIEQGYAERVEGESGAESGAVKVATQAEGGLTVGESESESSDSTEPDSTTKKKTRKSDKSGEAPDQ